MKSVVYSFIMAGGEGKRLWPLSTVQRPKQFMILPEGSTLFDHTSRRAQLISDVTWTITHQNYVELTHECLYRIDRIIAEPCKKNTGPALLLAAMLLYNQDPGAYFVALPSDHFITTDTQFITTITHALQVARQSACIVLIGIKPTSASQQYGYIMSDNNQDKSIITFEEKPTLERAEYLYRQENIWWNSGIVVAPVQVVMQLAAQFMPKVLHDINLFLAGDLHAYEKIDAISFDKALLEKISAVSGNLKLVPAHFEWSDVGTLENFLTHYGSAQTRQQLL